MKNKKSSTPECKISFKIVSDESTYHPTTKGRVLSFSRREFGKSGQIYLRVSYAPGIYNDGTFENYNKLRIALDSWLEPELLKHVEGGVWA